MRGTESRKALRAIQRRIDQLVAGTTEADAYTLARMLEWVRARAIEGLKVVGLALLLTACVHVAHEPGLEFPPRPAVRFFKAPVGICLSEADADQLMRFILKLNEFEDARERLLKD